MPKPVKTAVAVRNEKTPGRHFVGETLYLMVWPNGGKSWVQRLSIEGKRTDLGLGPHPPVSLAQARQKARENRSLVKSGGNPLAVKREEAMLAGTPTFEALARQHIAENRHSWKNAKHRAQWESTLETYVFPALGALKVNEIHPQARGRRALPHLDHQGGDRAACPTAHSLSDGPGRCPGVRRLQLSIARVYRPVVARVIEPPCGPVDGLLSPLGLRVNHLLSIEQRPVG